MEQRDHTREDSELPLSDVLGVSGEQGSLQEPEWYKQNEKCCDQSNSDTNSKGKSFDYLMSVLCMGDAWRVT